MWLSDLMVKSGVAGWLIASTGMMLMLTGCATADYLALDASEITIPACPTVQSIAVDELDSDTPPECRPAGSTLLFPSGAELVIDEHAGSGSFESTADLFRYSWIDVGDYGVVATQTTKNCVETLVWGRDAAIQKVRDAFGEAWACN